MGQAPRREFRFDLAVRFSDIDMMGHVNNGCFLTYLEDARVAFLAHLAGADDPRLRAGRIIARIEIDYVRPLLLRAEPITVVLWVERIGGRSFTLGYEIVQDGQVAARASSVVVAYDHGAGVSREVPPAERASLAQWLPE